MARWLGSVPLMPWFGDSRVVLAILVFLPIFTAPLSAQFGYNPGAGNPVFSTQGGGQFDSINLATGNVSINIPVRQKIGKIPLSASLVGNYGVYQSGAVWQTSAMAGTGVSTFGLTVPALSTVLAFTSTPTSCLGQQGDEVFSGFAVLDASGTAHPLPSTLTYDILNCAGNNPTSAQVTDGSGYTVLFGYYDDAYGLHYTIYDKSGNRYPETSFYPGTQVIDPDSATIGMATQSSQGQPTVTTYTDTLGTSALTATTPWLSPQPTQYSYSDALGNQQTYNVTFSGYYLLTAFGCTGIQEYDSTTTRLLPVSISVPGGGTYSITYEVTPGHSSTYTTGRIASLSLPSGGSITYTYGGSNHGINCTSQVVPTLTRKVNDNNGNVGNWTYVNTNSTAPNSQGQPQGNYTVTETDPAGDTITHYFSGEYETERQIQDVNLGVLSTTVTCYNGHNSTQSSCVAPSSVPALPITQTDVYTTLGSYTSLVETKYSSTYGTVTEMKQYDFGSTYPPSGTPLADSVITYNTGSTCGTVNQYVSDRPCSVIVNGTSGKASETDYTYNSGGHPTQTKRWVSGSYYLISSAAYGGSGAAAGVLSSSTDVNGAVTTLSNFTCNGMFPQTTTLPQLAGESFQMSTSQTWDTNCMGGVVTSRTGVNGDVTGFSYNDPLWRPSSMTPPVDGSNTAITYSPGTSLPWTVSSTSIIDSNNTFASQQVMDGLGRVVLSEVTSDPAGTDYTATTYDNLGRVSSVSNPYRSSDPIYSTTMSYDALGRMLSRTNADGTSARWTYSKRAASFVDENNKTKVFQYDGMGNLVSVCEVTAANQMGSGVPTACGQDIPMIGFLTTYTYDALGNVTSVSQPGVSNRTFNYDGLSRLTQEVNPESGTITYTYDASGQQGDLATITKPAANGALGTATATYTFDPMHRVTGISYADGGVTPYKGFVYDSSSIWGLTLYNVKGRLSEQYVGSPGAATSGAVYSYDAMGRVQDTDQCTPLLSCGTSYWHLNYGYNSAGDLTSLTNYAEIAGITYSYSYDAANHLLGVTSSLVNSTHPGTLWSTNSANYKASGLLGQASLGNGISRTLSYDTRNRLTGLTEGSVYNFSLHYNANSTIYNGNDSRNGNWSYTYDDLNRLSTASETGQSFTYSFDLQGNRWGTLATCTPSNTTTCQYTFSNNRITNAGVQYDLAGNVSYDGFHSYTHDFDGRITQVDGGSTVYRYDAMGARVAKIVSGSEYDFVVDQQGRAITGRISSAQHPWYLSEVYAGEMHVATYANNTTAFPHANWLGTVMASTGPNGSVLKNCNDVLPYGDGESCTGSDGSSLGFAGMWLDGEDSLNDTPNRNYQAVAGRWLTPDPAGLAAVDLTNPQTWNRYAYVTNNPVSLTDPSGLKFCPDANSPAICQGGYFYNAYFISFNSWDEFNNVVSFFPPGNDGQDHPVGWAINHAPTAPFDSGNCYFTLTCASPYVTPGAIAARSQFLAILSAKNGCSNFFNNAAANFSGSANGAEVFGSTDIRLIWPPQRSTVGAISTQGAGSSAPIFVNPNGPFFLSVSKAYSIGPYPAGTPQAQVTILAHEFAHTINALPADGTPLNGLGPGANVGLSVANTNAVLMKCYSAIGNAN